jgi:hypothetical protein
LEHLKSTQTSSCRDNNNTKKQQLTTATTITVMECMTTDRQLMMILRTLTQSYSDTTMNPNWNDRNVEVQASISWAEFIQCYKVCIYSMMTLQHLPRGSVTRLRARERSLSILALFEPTTVKSSTDVLAHLDRTSMQNHINVAMDDFTATKSFYTSNMTAATSNVTPPRRRPWFKKGTKRILPYIVGGGAVLLVAIWYMYTHSCWQVSDIVVHYPIEPIGYSVFLDKLNNVQNNIDTEQPTLVAETFESTLNETVMTGGTSAPEAPPLSINDIPSSKFIDNEIIMQVEMTNNSIKKNHFETSNDSNLQIPTQFHPLLGVWSYMK